MCADARTRDITVKVTHETLHPAKNDGVRYQMGRAVAERVLSSVQLGFYPAA